MKTNTARLMVLRVLLKRTDFLTPASSTSIIITVSAKARKSGGEPVGTVAGSGESQEARPGRERWRQVV